MVGFVYNFEMTTASSLSTLFYSLSFHATDSHTDIHGPLIVGSFRVGGRQLFRIYLQLKMYKIECCQVFVSTQHTIPWSSQGIINYLRVEL